MQLEGNVAGDSAGQRSAGGVALEPTRRGPGDRGAFPPAGPPARQGPPEVDAGEPLR